ncbi:MAG: medium chain dehydrogenase/reductase family protein, partial [Desulforhabdus sp.]|nr:medium chain dehydrogenase/reductase family protein [Desulforhabdus sp.]
LGHEICGFHPETRQSFVIWPGRACGACGSCLRGAENLCDEMCILGFHRDGGLAEFVTVEKTALIPIPADLPGEIGCLAEPLGCALNALQQVNLVEGEKLLIFGAGPVGLLMALAAASKGIETHIAEINPAKLQRSREFRARLNIAAAQDEDTQFDAVINAAPTAETLISGLVKLRPGGCFCLFSGLTDAAELSIQILNDIHYRQLRVAGAYGCTSAQMREALELLSNRSQDVLLLIERRLRLEEVPDALLQVLKGEKFKFIVKL